MSNTNARELLSKFVGSAQAQMGLSTISAEGVPTTVLGGEYFISERGTLLFREYLESSVTNRNLLHALWFSRPVSIAVQLGDTSLHAQGVPTHAHVAGPIFQQHYESATQTDPHADLATVWEIRVDQVDDVSPVRLRTEQDIRRPFFRHLDRLVQSSG